MPATSGQRRLFDPVMEAAAREGSRPSLLGVGIDIVSIDRIGSIVARYGTRFERRWFHPIELSSASDRCVALARSFAVKEAVVKALPSFSCRRLPWRDIITSGRVDSDQVAVEIIGLLALEAFESGGRIAATATQHGDIVLAAVIIELT